MRALNRLWDSGRAIVGMEPRGGKCCWVPQLDGDADEGGIAEVNRHLDEEELGSEDDDIEEAPDHGNNEILTQFDKVDRTKNRYKCKFKHGMVHIKQDYMYSECKAEFEF